MKQQRADAEADVEVSAQSIDWLREVDGQLMRNREDPEGPNAWVAIARTPAPTGRRGKLILGFGESAEEAASAAESSWRQVWGGMSAMH